MYIHLGQNLIVRSSEVVGIFDIESTTVSEKTRQFLKKAEKKGEVVTVSYDMPKSFVVCADSRKNKKIYISQISPTTLLKRSVYIDNL